jgi:DNA primase large subunit
VHHGRTRGADWLWLIDAESRLFTLRLAQTGAQQSVVTLSELGVTYEGERGDADSQSDTEPSDWTGFHRSRAPPSRQPARYRVPFEHAGRLVRRRQVEMQRGFCLVMAEDMRHVAVHHFKAMLLRQMNVLLRSLLMVSCDESARLDPVLGRVIASWQRDLVQQGSMGRSGLSARARIKLNEVDSASATHFPLCMRHLHRKFRENHHLKYDGRVQYRMFLKGLGLSVQESLLFFRSEFVKVIASAKFDKEYAYHIRHSYGLEGSRKDYSPLDCHQILSGPAPRLSVQALGQRDAASRAGQMRVIL